VGHGSPDLPPHPVEVRLQEAENVRGAVEQRAHAEGLAGGFPTPNPISILLPFQSIFVHLTLVLQNYERMNLADALVSKSYDNGERIIKQGK